MIRFWLKQVLTDGILVIACIIIFGLIFNSVTAKKAKAHDPQTHQADSLSDAKSEAYGLCCNGEDYLRVSLWETTATGYRVFVRGTWYEASPRVKVNNMENPDADAKVWINGTPGAMYIRCFMPGSLF